MTNPRCSGFLRRAGRILACLALLLLLTHGHAAAADGPDFWISPDGSLTPDAITCSRAEDGKYYLMLPANLDTEKMCFGVADGVRLTYGGKSIAAGDSAARVREGSVSVKAGKSSFTLHIMTGSPGLPALYITTESGKLNRIEASKAYREAGKLVFTGPDGAVQYNGDLDQIKARGNSSMTFAKKNYQIKLSEGASLMGMGKAKKWILTGNYRDKSYLRNCMMMDLAEAVGLAFTPEHCFAELYINHEYRGLYLFSEKIEIDDDRIDITDLEKATEELNDQELGKYKLIGKKASTKGSFKAYEIPNDPEDITGGYLMELESYSSRYRDEASAYTLKKGMILVIKSPEYTSRAQMKYITGLMQSFENAIHAQDGRDPETGKHYTELADLDSLALKYMIEELSENYDGNSSSQYFYKPADSEGGKIMAGPVWDYDSTFGTYAQKHNMKKVLNPEYLWIAEGERNAWYPTLWRRADFRQRVAELWNGRMKECTEVLLGSRKPEESSFGGKLRSLDEYAEMIQASAKMDRIRWPRMAKKSATATAWTGGTFKDNTTFLKDYLKQRCTYLDKAWGGAE